MCVLVQWREATRIQSDTNSLRAPGFFVFVFFQLTLCVFSKESIEERWSAQSLGKPHKTFLFLIVLAFSELFELCFAFPVSEIFLKHSFANLSSLTNLFRFTGKKRSPTSEKDNRDR